MKALRSTTCAALVRGAVLAASIALTTDIRCEELLASAQMDRLMAFGQLWGFMKYSHPWLAYRGAEWDDAFVQTVPAVMSANSPLEYRAGVEALLKHLNDPATRLHSSEDKPRAKPSFSSFAIEAQTEVVVIHFGVVDKDTKGIVAKLKAANGPISEAKAVIFDLQGVKNTKIADNILEQSGLNSLLVTNEMWAPSTRVRLHKGFPPETGITSGGYFSGFVSSDGKHFVPKVGAKFIPCAFIVSGPVPSIALALQDQGCTAIISTSSDCEYELVQTVERGLPDNVVVDSRLEELVHADGSIGFLPDAIVADETTAFAAARRWLLEPNSRKRARNPEISVRVPSSSNQRPGTLSPLPTTQPNRLLAAFRAWSIIEYFFPYKNLMDANWTALVRAALPDLINSSTELEYQLAIKRMLTPLNDGHVGVTSEIIINYLGRASPPIDLKMVEGSPVIVEIVEPALPPESHVAVGDELVSIDTKPWREHYDELAPYFAASTPQGRDFKELFYLLSGPPESTVTVKLRDLAGIEREIKLVRKSEYRSKLSANRNFAPNKGETFRLLGPDTGYVDLTRLEVADVDTMFERLRATRAIVFDMRGYPRLTAWPIGARLVDRKGVPAARAIPPVFAPGLSENTAQLPRWTYSGNVLPPTMTRYAGRTVMLIDERAASQAEYTGQVFRAANETVFVGSGTAGVCGDVTSFGLPGGITVTFSGQSWEWPDGKQLQRVGLIPDVPAKPTKVGLAAGRDEVLEAAMAYIDRVAK